MANRKLPFGYQMENGQIEPHPGEAKTVQWIFQHYAAGASYSKITNSLQTRGIPYMAGKCWNKNMVARILEDRRYTGTDGYPRLIDLALFQSVRASVPSKVVPIKKNAECAAVQWLAVCGTCGAKVLRDPNQHGKERWQCPKCKSISTKTTDKSLTAATGSALNRLVADPCLIMYPDANSQEVADSVRQAESDFKQMLAAPSFNESAARGKAISLAATRFNALGSEDYETMRIQHVLAKAEQIAGLDTVLLRQITSAILIHPTGAVSLKLKNGQIIERTDCT